MRTAALTLTALLACVPAAAAQETSAERWSTGWVFDGEGHPRLESKVFGTATAFVEWRRCPPEGGGCVPILSTPPNPFYASGGIALPGDTTPGTVFEAAYVRDGVEVAVRATWKGRVTMAAPPAVTGDAVVGATVGVRPARWEGGWDAEGVWDTGHSHGELLACPTPTGGSCWAVDRTLDPRWAGQYLLVREERHALGVGGTEVQGMRVPPYPAGIVDTSSATRFRVFSAPVQVPPVAPVPLTAAPAMTKAPAVTLRKRALRAKGRLSLGRVTCSVRCKVAVKVSGGGKRAYTTTFAVTGTRAITVPPRRGNVQVRVHVDGTLSATGRVRAR